MGGYSISLFGFFSESGGQEENKVVELGSICRAVKKTGLDGLYYSRGAGGLMQKTKCIDAQETRIQMKTNVSLETKTHAMLI